MDKRLDHFIDYWMKKWSSSHVDVKVRVRNFVHPMEVTVIVYIDNELNTLCKTEFKIGTKFQYRCFKRCTEGLLLAYCKTVHEGQDF